MILPNHPITVLLYGRQFDLIGRAASLCPSQSAFALSSPLLFLSVFHPISLLPSYMRLPICLLLPPSWFSLLPFLPYPAHLPCYPQKNLSPFAPLPSCSLACSNSIPPQLQTYFSPQSPQFLWGFFSPLLSLKPHWGHCHWWLLRSFPHPHPHPRPSFLLLVCNS